MASIRVKEPVPEDETVPTEPVTEAEATPPPPEVAPVNIEPTTSPHSPSVKTSQNQTKLILGGIALLAIIAIIVVVGLLNDRKQLKQEVSQLKTASPQSQSQDEAEELKKEISQYLQLPADEVPTVATVVDADKVRSQSFFTNTENGDKVLLFAKSGKAILYRPSTKKIIEVSPINLNQDGAADTTGGTTPTTPTTDAPKPATR